jgi:ATP-binding cassette, subfamily B, multidrug efflux pump
MFKQSRIDLKVFKRLIKFVKIYRKLLIIAFLCTIVLAILTPARPFLIGKIVNQYIIAEQNQQALLNWTLILIASAVF